MLTAGGDLMIVEIQHGLVCALNVLRREYHTAA
jgi:hypothetical protein